MAHEALSRRKMLEMLGAFGAAGVMSAGAFAACSTSTTTTDTQTATQPEKTSVELKVYDPTGSIEIRYTFAARIDGFDNKTIGFVSDDSWEIDRMYPIIQEYLRNTYQNVTIVDETNFIHGIDAITKANNGIPEKMLELGVDAAIVGNAG